MKHRLHRRLMAVFVGVCAVVAALFLVFAWGLGYRIETHLQRNAMDDAAREVREHHARYGEWRAPEGGLLRLYTDAAALPTEMAEALKRPPGALSAPGAMDGLRYRWRALGADGAGPWLVVDLSHQVVIRPMRQLLVGWLGAWAALCVLLAVAAAWGLSRYLTAPLNRLTARVQQLGLEPPTVPLAEGLRDDEVGLLAQRFDALLQRLHAFVQREQSFVRDASHELRTPVSVLRLGIERLQADPTLPAHASHSLRSLHAATRWMQSTLDGLLLLAREDLRAGDAVRVLPLVEDWVLAHADLLDERHMALDLHIDHLAALHLPAPVLQLVVASLLGNALTHGAEGGCIELVWHDGGLDIRNPIGAAGHSGNGLGLVLVRRLLERHGGQLSLNLADGRAVARVEGKARLPTRLG